MSYVQDAIKPLLPQSLGWLERAFFKIFGELNATFHHTPLGSYFYTPDTDRGIRDYGGPLYTAFKVSLILKASYQAVLHSVDAFAYHPGHKQWERLDHCPNVTQGHRDSLDWIRRFKKSNPFPLRRLESARQRDFEGQQTESELPRHISAGQSQELVIGPVGISLREGFDHGTRSIEQHPYTDLFLVLNVNTTRLFLYIVLPEMTSVAELPAYFVGPPYKFRDEPMDRVIAYAETHRIHLIGDLRRSVRMLWRL